jgi:P27 family predicted phage terminase small subunit
MRPGKAPRPPAWLSDAAKAKWRDVAKLLADVGILTHLDLDLVGLYCETWVAWKQACDVVATEGLTYATESGQRKPHPATLLAAQARKDLLAMENSMGLTPASRQRLRIEMTAPGPEDPFEKFLLN